MPAAVSVRLHHSLSPVVQLSQPCSASYPVSPVRIFITLRIS